jgi:hypothetical protein
MVKKVWLGQAQEPVPEATDRGTQEVQLVAELQMPQPDEQGWQVLLASA